MGLGLGSPSSVAAAQAGLAPGLGSPMLLMHSPAAGAAAAGGLSQQTPGLLPVPLAGVRPLAAAPAVAAQPAAAMVPLSAVGGGAAGAAAPAGSPPLQQPAHPQPALTEQSDGFVTAREQQTLATGATAMAPTPLSTAASRPEDVAAAAQLAAAGAAAGAAASAASAAIMAAGPGGAEQAAAASPSQAQSDGSFAFHKAAAPGGAQPATSGAPTPALHGAGADADAAAAPAVPDAVARAGGRSPQASGLGLLSAGPAMDEGAGFAEYQFDEGAPAAGLEEVAVPSIDWSAKTQEEIVRGGGGAMGSQGWAQV